MSYRIMFYRTLIEKIMSYFLALILLDFTFLFIFRHWPIFTFFHIITLLNVHILHYWGSQKDTNERLKFIKGVDYGFNGFDTPFSKNLIEFFTFVFNCSFYFVFVFV